MTRAAGDNCVPGDLPGVIERTGEQSNDQHQRTASEVHDLARGARLSTDVRRRTVALQGDQPRSDLPADKLADVEWLDGFIREWNDAAEREDAGEDEDDA
jgi:hypothetical protein